MFAKWRLFFAYALGTKERYKKKELDIENREEERS